jgi:hypothetical protein
MINNKIPLEILKRENKFTLEEIGAVFVMMNQSELDLKDLAYWINSFEYADTINDLVYGARIVIIQGALQINPIIPIGKFDDEEIIITDEMFEDDYVPSDEPPIKKTTVPVCGSEFHRVG